MAAKVIFIVGGAGTGKSSIGQVVAEHFQCCLLDKDFLCNRFTGKLLETQGISPNERDGCEFYGRQVMPLEYEALLDVAADNVACGNSVVLVAPFLGFFGDRQYLAQVREKYGWADADILVLSVTIQPEVLYERIKERGSDRDDWKMVNWDTFVKGLKMKQCLWEGVKVLPFDNSADVRDNEKLLAMLEAGFRV